MEERKVLLRYRGRNLSEEDAAFIRALIARHPDASRRRLSALLCEAWGWRQPNGALCDVVCRGLMLALHRAGHITLPPLRCVVPNNIVGRRLPAPVELDASPVETKLSELQPLEFIQVRRTTGRGKDDHTYKPNRPLKDVLGYPLDKRFRDLLGRLP